MPDVIMAGVIMADAPPLKRQRGDAVLVGKNIISSRILKYGYREHQVCFMLVAGKDRQFITKVNKTDAWAALQKGIHLPVLQMQPCPGQGANVFHARNVQVQHYRCGV